MILSKSIDSVRDQLDKPPNEITLGMGELKNLLSEWFVVALNLEAGAGISDFAKENEALKEEIEALKSKQAKELNAVNAEHDQQINSLRQQIEELAKINAEQDEARKQPSDKGFLILNKLKTASKLHQTIEEIAQRCVMSETEVNLVLAELVGGKWVETSFEIQRGVVAFRTVRGDSTVMEQWARDPSTLAESRERILIVLCRAKEKTLNERVIHGALMSRGDEISLDDVIAILAELQSSGHVRRHAMELAQGAGFDWYLMPFGETYLGKRGMLPDENITNARGGDTETLKTEIARLNADFLHVSTLLSEKSDEVEKLKLVLNPPRRREIEEEILLVLDLPGTRTVFNYTASRIGFYFDIGEAMAGVYLERLRKAGFTIAQPHPEESGLLWYRTEQAAEYLAVHGLLQRQHEEFERRRVQREEEERRRKEAGDDDGLAFEAGPSP